MISIIIPSYNRSKQLYTTLFSFNNLDFEGVNFEIIIIDNGSTDDTPIIVRDFIDSNPNFKIIYKYDDTSGLLTGRHLGAKIANGNILTFIDDDVVLTRNWLRSIDTLMMNSDIDLLTGPCLPLYESYPPKWLNYFWRKTAHGGKVCLWLSLIDLEKDNEEIDPNYVWGLNFTIRKNVFLELKGFNPDNISKKLQMFQGDGETGLTNKAALANKKAYYSKGVMLYHQISNERLTYEYFEKRAFYAGVCNSYSLLRYGENNGIVGSKLSFINKFMSYYYNLTFRLVLIFNPEYKSLYRRFYLKEQEGFKYHQELYKINLGVRNWVHKDNYLNYELPDFEK
jgi:glycosyltransferase involved in cell wall biosynthesis